MTSRNSFFPSRLLKQALYHSLPSTSKRSICNHCRNTLRQSTILPLAALHQQTSTRPFSTSLATAKKSSASSKSSRNSPPVKASNKSEHIPDNKATASRDAEIDPYDFSELESGISNAISRLKDALTKTRDAGRVTAEMVESLPVELNIKGSDTHGGSAHKETNRIGDLASVVPKGGRVMQVFCAEESHIKPITSAIVSSPHSLVPQPDAQNPLLLLIPVPPATAETRQQAAAEAKKCMDKAALEVRNARGDAQKRFRKMELGKLVIKDELVKAHKGMEEVVRKGQDEVKKVYEGALKALER